MKVFLFGLHYLWGIRTVRPLSFVFPAINEVGLLFLLASVNFDLIHVSFRYRNL